MRPGPSLQRPAAATLALILALPAVAAEGVSAGSSVPAAPAADMAGHAAGDVHAEALDAILALMETSDPAWGEYLAADCRSCHREGAAGAGIPDIWSWPGQSIAMVLADYRAGLLENPAMQTIARRYSDAEIAAIAAYFDSRQ